MTEAAFDQTKSDAFARHMLDVVNNGAVALMISIGHRVGLFDAMAQRAPATSQQIADAAGLNERYVREWLGAMVTGRVVDYAPADGTYALPAEHAAFLTRAAGVNNWSLSAMFIPLLAQVEDDIVACFRQGGGVPYSSYPRFQQLMAENSAAFHDTGLIPTILPLVPGITERLQAGLEVADIGCGSGHAINLMAQACPHSRFTGYDFSEEGVAVGRREAQALGLANAFFEARDVARLELHDRFDLMTAFDAIHDQAQPAQVLAGIIDALRPGGIFLMVDIGASSYVHENLGLDLGPWLYTVSCLHCMTVSLALNVAGLGAMWGEQKAGQMLAEAGFAHVESRRIEGDPVTICFICAK